MIPKNPTAHLAGIIYLIVVLGGIFSLAYVPSKLIVWDDPGETLSRLQSLEQLFRLGIMGSIITYLSFLLLPLVLYRLLHDVNQHMASLMVIFAITSIPISFSNIQHPFTILTLISHPEYLRELDARSLQSSVMFYLELYNNGIMLLQIFWGLWLFPLGYLIYHSRFLPKILGILLIAGCFGYLIKFTGNFLFPGFGETLISKIVGIPASLGEMGTCLWLLVMGTRKLVFSKYTKTT